jgi:hypothetical protein
VFVFRPGDGADTIMDFQPGNDAIEFNDAPFHDFTELKSLMHPSGAGGADTIINFTGGDSVTLKGVNVNVLQASDFVIHPHQVV